MIVLMEVVGRMTRRQRADLQTFSVRPVRKCKGWRSVGSPGSITEALVPFEYKSHFMRWMRVEGLSGGIA